MGGVPTGPGRDGFPYPPRPDNLSCSSFAGLDQANVGMSLTLRGSGEVNVVVTVDGQSSNAVTINIQ